MPQWLRNLVMLVVLTAWLVVVGFSIYKGEIPGAPVLGIPAAVVIALSPPGVITRRRRLPPRQNNRDAQQGDSAEDEEPP